MQKPIRTTITLPENIYMNLKIRAVKEKKTLSELVIHLTQQATDQTKPIPKHKKDPLKLLGQLNGGIKKLYTNRDELYEDRTKHIMGDR